jgi:hypothetical protein
VGAVGGAARGAGMPQHGGGSAGHERRRVVVVVPSSQAEAGGVPVDAVSGAGRGHGRPSLGMRFFPVSIRFGQGRGDKVH